MKAANQLDYTIHHLCVYDAKPREHMWPYLRWHHGITNFFSGAIFHITDEGHSDYTFLGCGGRAFQIQLEAPPFQFKYEQDWYKAHGNGYNHICWVTSDARASYEQLQAEGAGIVQEFETFPTYLGFVCKDPEGRWIEIMEYTDAFFRVQEFTNAPSGECGLQMIGNVEVCEDVDAMVDWYEKALDLHVLKAYRNGDDVAVYMSDKDYDPKERNTVFVLTTTRNQEDRKTFESHGPFISRVIYQAHDVQQAYKDALWAGMAALSGEPKVDPLTGALTARLREPSGNIIELREIFKSE